MWDDILLEVRDLKKYFYPPRGVFGGSKEVIRAVDGVDLYIRRGETLGLVGESGCGKTTMAKLILGLVKPTSGDVFFEQRNIFKLGKRELRRLRPSMQLIFQDPYGSLNPRMNVKGIIAEGLRFHKLETRKSEEQRVAELLEMVGLKPKDMYRYPHEFSGGQRQRISIARALSVNPKFIIADEPVSALDVSIQAQILNLLMELKETLNLTYLFISHDLMVVKHISDRIAVMHRGKIVETATTWELFQNPSHPYTKMLLTAIPIPDPDIQRPTMSF
ncbi:MAG TPA: ABC transporter ATP-binding protein [Syntrophaceae bacterium]|nr:ABC transporter ATP-binding protein [Syntrophaceae bacterium]